MISGVWGGCIPGRAIFNNCIMFVAEVKRISSKKTLTKEELEVKNKAIAVAALASNRSWKTYKYLNNYGTFDKDSLMTEATYAFQEGWKNISEADVEEVVNSEFNPHIFSTWIFSALDEKKKREFLTYFDKLKKDQEYGLEPLEREQ